MDTGNTEQDRSQRNSVPESQSTSPPATLDLRSFAAQYETVYAKLALIAVSIVGDRVQADDIVQDAAVVALRKLSDFAPGTNFGAWMAMIVRRTALNYARKTKNRATFAADPHSFEVSVDVAPSESALPMKTTTGDLVDGQTVFDDEVVRALSTLGQEARCCLLLRTVLDLSYAEISELTDLPEGTAMSHVHRSKQAMRKRLKAQYGLSEGSDE